MRVVIAEIPEEGLQVTERLDPAALATSDVSWVAPLEVSAFVQRHDDDLTAMVEAAGTLEMVCARCLATVRRPYHETFHVAIEIQSRASVELTDDIRQEILLGYPMIPLCRDDCRGLCPTCGHNVNEGVCSHGTA